MTDATNTNQPKVATQPLTVEQLNRTLDEWRGRIDELLVHVDLAELDMRDELRSRINQVENAYLAAKSQFEEVGKDVRADVGAARERVQKLLHDLRQVYDATEAAVRRSRHN
jgi:molecular chaperone GrpE (heat shock protein)